MLAVKDTRGPKQTHDPVFAPKERATAIVRKALHDGFGQFFLPQNWETGSRGQP